MKRFGKVIAVNGLDLEVEEGSITGLIGPNGAGKTTTIRMILGLLRPDAGVVRTFGEDPWDNSGIRERIGVVHERPNFPRHLEVDEYLRHVAAIYGVGPERVRDVLELVGLSDAADQKIGTLSAGMLQRFAVAHALIHEPELVIADEPTSNLDPQARSDLLDLIARLNREQGTTFLISSHILPELSRVCEKVAIINRGRVWAAGSLTELYERFGVSAVRVSTDKPAKMAGRISALSYVKGVEVVGNAVIVSAEPGDVSRLYQDVPKIALEVGAQLTGIETKTATLEELFRHVVATSEVGMR